MTEREILRRTMKDRARVTRQMTEQGVKRTVTVYDGVECALSRTVNSALPRLEGEWSPVCEDRYRMMLYLPAGVHLRPGDRVEVKREGQLVCGLASGSVSYPSHAAAGIEIQEVNAAE